MELRYTLVTVSRVRCGEGGVGGCECRLRVCFRSLGEGRGSANMFAGRRLPPSAKDSKAVFQQVRPPE